jgi:hypothetical protein
MLTKPQVSNYELGVIVPVYDAKEADDIICWDRPPKSYESRGDQPWVSTDCLVPYLRPLTFPRRFRVNQLCSTN